MCSHIFFSLLVACLMPRIVLAHLSFWTWVTRNFLSTCFFQGRFPLRKCLGKRGAKVSKSSVLCFCLNYVTTSVGKKFKLTSSKARSDKYLACSRRTQNHLIFNWRMTKAILGFSRNSSHSYNWKGAMS